MFDFHNVRMPEKPEELDFSQNASRIGDVLKNVVDFLNRNLLSGEGIHSGANDTIAALADDLLDFVPTCITVFGEEFRFDVVLATLVGGLHAVDLEGICAESYALTRAKPRKCLRASSVIGGRRSGSRF